MARITGHEGRQCLNPREITGLWPACRLRPEGGFSLAPSQLDLREFGGIGGKVAQRGVRGFDRFANPRHFMGTKVIHKH